MNAPRAYTATEIVMAALSNMADSVNEARELQAGRLVQHPLLATPAQHLQALHLRVTEDGVAVQSLLTTMGCEDLALTDTLDSLCQLCADEIERIAGDQAGPLGFERES